MIDSGPFIVANLRGRVESLSSALDRAQERIDELEKVFGSDAELLPLIQLGLTPGEARLVHLIRSRDVVTRAQLQHAAYADDPDHMDEIDADNTVKVRLSCARRKLRKFGITFASVGYGCSSTGHRMSGPDKARLAKLIASGARLVTRGRPDRKHYRQAAE
jgi:hypothetical protein